MNKFNKKYWEDHYQERKNTDRTPSPHLLSEIYGLTPNIALDAGCGEGADAIWLAQNGWQVTAVDISDTALKKASNAAEALDLSINFEHVDLTNWSPKECHFDLVTSQYVHTTNNKQFIEILARAVKRGGTLLIVGHQPSKANEVDHHAHGSHITAEEISAHLNPDEWEIKVAEPCKSERMHMGKKIILSDSVLVAKKKLAPKSGLL